MAAPEKAVFVSPTRKEGEQLAAFDKDYSDQDADLTLVSSDAAPVAFKIHSYFLLAISPVFRSMISVAPANAPPSLHFTDKIERAVVLKLLLRLACNDPTINFDLLPAVDALDLIRLSQKWDCAAPLRILELFVRQPVTNGADVFHRFFYACALDDADTATRFLPDAAALKWPDGGQRWARTVHESISGASKLDPANMSSFWIDQLPRKYFLALLRSSRLRSVYVAEPGTSHLPNRPKVPTPWAAVAEDFKVQLKLQDKRA